MGPILRGPGRGVFGGPKRGAERLRGNSKGFGKRGRKREVGRGPKRGLKRA